MKNYDISSVESMMVKMPTGATASASAALCRPTRVRHAVLGLTIAAYMITYMDRVVISTAVPSIQKEFGFSIITMGWILSSFQWAYALFQIPVAWLGDRIGARRALTLIVGWWSIFTSATTLAWGAGSIAALRFLFGMGEAGAFPIATASLSRWVLPSERGFAQGATHAGSRLGGALTPAAASVLIAHYGWRSPFLAFGCLGLIWAAAWHWYYRDSPAAHPSVNKPERYLIERSLGPAVDRRIVSRSVPWKRILSSPQMWILSAMYFCYAYNISVYLVWFPKYLNDSRGFSLQQMGLFASLPLLAGTAGDLLGGWISDIWTRHSGNIRTARRFTAIAGFLMAALCIVPACYTTSPYRSVMYSCLALFALELTVGVSWAIPLDIGGAHSGSVAAIMNTCGNLGGAIASAASAYLVKLYGWNVPFLVVAALSLVAAALYCRIHAGRPIVAS